jgi:signal transduction histidine kinase
MPFVHSFRARLLHLLLIGVLPALAIIVYLNFDQRRLQAKQVRQRLTATSTLGAANEQNYFDHTRQLLATLTQFRFLTLATDRDFAHQHLENLRKLSPDYLNFGLVQSNGLLFCSSEPFTAPFDLGDRPYVRRVIERRQFSAGEFQVGRLTGEPALNFGWPVLEENGRLDRVLFASLRLSLLSEALSRIPLQAQESITVIDRYGTIVARAPNPEQYVGRKWDRETVEQALKLKHGMFDLKGTDRVRRLHAISPVYDADAASLFVSVDVPASVSYARANWNLARNRLLLAILAAIIVLAGRYYAVRFFLAPVRVLSRASTELANGNLRARVGPITGSAELAQLGAAFDEMAQRVEQRDAQIQKDQAEIRRNNEELEDRVRERTAELQAANRELEAFSYSVSHDLRAPLRHISGFVDLLQRQGEALDSNAKRLVGFIEAAARQMNQLVDDLLQFSRMSRAEIRLTDVDMSKVVAEIQAGLQAEVNGRAVEWVVNPLPAMRGDPALLRVVVTNLLENAVKYTRPRNPARIEVGIQSDGATPTIYVRDNGVGFDMKYAKRLFGVFQRFHHAEDFEGTGIGLATVHWIVTRLGGKIWAEARPDEGATFYFSLPQATMRAS